MFRPQLSTQTSRCSKLYLPPVLARSPRDSTKRLYSIIVLVQAAGRLVWPQRTRSINAFNCLRISFLQHDEVQRFGVFVGDRGLEQRKQVRLLSEQLDQAGGWLGWEEHGADREAREAFQGMAAIANSTRK